MPERQYVLCSQAARKRLTQVRGDVGGTTGAGFPGSTNMLCSRWCVLQVDRRLHNVSPRSVSDGSPTEKCHWRVPVTGSSNWFQISLSSAEVREPHKRNRNEIKWLLVYMGKAARTYEVLSHADSWNTPSHPCMCTSCTQGEQGGQRKTISRIGASQAKAALLLDLWLLMSLGGWIRAQ